MIVERRVGLVAGISKLQINELKSRSVTTTAALASMPLPLQWKPERGSAQTYERIREQARLQFEARTKGAPVYELLKPQPGFGLSKLPEPSPGDIFLDFEGNPFVGERGLEYLLGYVTIGESGGLAYTSLDAEHNVHDKPHLALHELLREPAGNSANDDGCDPADLLLFH
jgi:predicted RecB family nuclease